MTTTTTMTERFNELPRAIRWLLVTVAFVVAFFAWDGTIGSTIDGWNTEADRIETQLARISDTSNVSSRLQKRGNTIVSLGPVDLPCDESDGRSALTNAVVDVLEHGNYKVTYGFDLGGGGDKLREDLSRDIVSHGGRVARLTGALKFEASPEDAIAIIAAFDGRTDIDAIRKVTITKAESSRSPKVKVAITLEKWVEVSSTRRG